MEFEGWDDPDGVPIDIIIFGGRRAGMVPLVHESLDWDHGVFMGVSASSETTAAIIDKEGKMMPPRVRRDPFAMLPFCGYNMGDYFQHWFDMGDKVGKNAPRIFYVNWFRKDEKGNFIWPGFGDNSRILEWMCDRVDGRAGAVKTPIGMMPEIKDLDLEGVAISEEDMEKLLEVDISSWSRELEEIEAFLEQFGDHYTERLKRQVQGLKERLEEQ
jgi:phosphoenolpyruvate carboxykinase (GTP)